jgi:Flp pilus assembly protein TadD
MKKIDVNFLEPPQQQLNTLLKYYKTGRYADAEKLSLSITQEFPKHQFAWKVLAAVLKQTGRINESLIISQKSVELDPQDAEAHNNLGNTLKELGRLDEAEVSYTQAITLKPDYAEAYNNLGVMLQELGRLVEAEASFRQAITLKPDYAEAYNNLGVMLQELGRLVEAEASYKRATKLKPKYREAQYNLIQLLNVYSSQKESSHSIIKVDQEIKKIDLIEKTSGIISDDKIIQLFNKSISIMERYNLELQNNDSQIYRRNTVDLNCKRHKQIFDKFNIIPEFCFGCFKVQIEPKSLLDLIKLFLVFNQIKLAKNNTRKCMIEFRSETSGFYKGFIYCSSVTEAYQIADHLEKIINVNISLGLLASVKRGCSEYPVSFPDFKKVNRSGVELMNYDESWKLIEKDHDSKILNRTTIVKPSLSYLNLSDVLIIRNWIDYAKGIGDPSVEFLNHQTVSSQKYYNIAKTRLETYTFQV